MNEVRKEAMQSSGGAFQEWETDRGSEMSLCRTHPSHGEGTLVAGDGEVPGPEGLLEAGSWEGVWSFL